MKNYIWEGNILFFTISAIFNFQTYPSIVKKVSSFGSLSLVGAIAVIIDLYVVIWGKAKDPQKMKQEVDSEQPSDQPKTIEVFIDDSLEKTSCKIDLEEPLLPQKLP